MRRQQWWSLVLATVLVAVASIAIAVRDDGAGPRRASAAGGTFTQGGSTPDGGSVVTEGPSSAGTGSAAPDIGPTAASAPSGPGIVVPGPRGKATPVKVGVHLGDNRSAGAMFGVGGLPDISPAEVDAVVKQVNAAGGLGGSPIVPVYHRTDPLNGSFDSQGQKACADLIEDKHVQLLVDNALTPSKVVMECASKRHVPIVWELHMAIVTNAETTRLADTLYRPSMPNADRLGFVIDGLAKAGFFDHAKVGIIRYDAPEAKLIENIWRPRLAAHHVPVVSEFTVVHPDAATGAATMSGDASNAVLQFRQAGVSHVLFVPSGGAIPLVFLPAAASQGWNPRYGLTTQDAPTFLAKNFGDQLHGAMAEGWAPDLDGDPTPLKQPANLRCRAALQKAGLPWDGNIQPFCDAFYFLQRSLRGSSGFSVPALRTGAEAIGSSFESPYVFGTRFARGRHDGPASARAMRFDTGAGRFVYFGASIGF